MAGKKAPTPRLRGIQSPKELQVTIACGKPSEGLPGTGHRTGNLVVRYSPVWNNCEHIIGMNITMNKGQPVFFSKGNSGSIHPFSRAFSGTSPDDLALGRPAR